MTHPTIEVIAEKITVAAPSMQENTLLSVQEFIANRFYALSVSHNNTILIGSSLAHQQTSLPQEQVLDAAASTFILDKNNVIIGIRQATADGLGGSADDPDENTSIAKIASFACKSLIEDSASLEDIYYSIAADSKKQALELNRTQKYDSHCAMAAASFIYTGAGKYQGELANLGDTTLFVLSHDFQIKTILPAQQVYRGFNTWTPPSVQMLNLPSIQAQFKPVPFEASEGDLIISMTDGIWGELPLLQTETKPDQRQFLIDTAQLHLSNSGYTPVQNYGLDLLTQTLKQSLQKRKELLSLIDELGEFDANSQKLLVSEVLSSLRENDKVHTATALETLLFSDKNGDGITYFRDIEIPFYLVIHDLKKRSAGDCSTLNLTRIPYHLDELIRAFINFPDNRSALIKEELKPYLQSAPTVAESIARLKQERVLLKSKLLLNELNTEPVFDENFLENIETLLEHLAEIYSFINPSSNYTTQMQLVENYFEGLNKSLASYLFPLIKDDLAPPFRLINLFSSKSQTLFNNFCLKFGPGLVFSTTDFLDEKDPNLISSL